VQNGFEPIAVNQNKTALRVFCPFDPYITSIHRNQLK
jgi:hypothetical protein